MVSKSLIAFFSRKGFNYANGGIINLPVGNTEIVAHKIQLLTGGGNDMFHIEPQTAYPIYYTETTEIAQKEMRENSRPAIRGEIEDISRYKNIFLGYPNWWGTMPMVVFTFLGKYDFSGKTIIPFCTHEGSGMGSSERDISTLCPNAKLLPGLAIRGSDAGQSDKIIREWLESNALLKK